MIAGTRTHAISGRRAFGIISKSSRDAVVAEILVLRGIQFKRPGPSQGLGFRVWGLGFRV